MNDSEHDRTSLGIEALTTRFSRRTLAKAGAATAAAATLGIAPRLTSAQSATPAAATPYAGEKVTITYGFWDSAQEDAIKTQIEAFNKHFPDITVEPQIVPWADYWTQLQTAVAGGQTFDVFWINTASLPVYASVNALLPITSVVGGTDGVDASQLPQSLVESYAWDGVQYGLPRDFDTQGLFYNKDIFDKAGVAYPDDTWTWDTFKETATKLNDSKNLIYGAGLQTSWQENYYNFIWQNEGDLLDDAMTKSLVGEQPASDAFVYLTDFFTQELTPSIAAQQTNPVADTLFPAGTVAMMTGGSFRAGTYAKADANIDVAPLPQGKKRASAIHGLANVIWAGTKSGGAALELVKWLAGEEAETLLGQSGATIPAYGDLAKIWIDANPDLNLQAFLDAVDYGVSVESPKVGFQWQIDIQGVVIKGWNAEIAPEEIGPQAATAADASL